MSRMLYKVYGILVDYKNHMPDRKKTIKILKESQYWNREEMESYQLGKLNELLACSMTANYYRQIYRDISLPLNRITQMSEIPIVEKAIFQKDFKSFGTADYEKKGWPGRSSGSTGLPTAIYISKLAMVYRAACRWRFLNWWGATETDRWINFTAYPRHRVKLKSKIKCALTPRFDVDILNINSGNIRQIVDEISEFKPVFFRGYPSAIVNFCMLVKSEGVNVSNIKLKMVVTTSEILYDSDRQLIEQTLNTKVANEYGSAEQGMYAFECPEGGFHIQEEMVFFNVNDKNEVISTELHNSLMPLINYRVGDKAVISNKYCTCGVTSRLLDTVEGRIGSDDILTPDGRRLNYLFFDRMIKKLGGTELWGNIKRFQIIQEDYIFRFLIVKLPGYNHEMETYITEYIRNGLGEGCSAKFEYHTELSPEKSGKFRIFRRETK